MSYSEHKAGLDEEGFFYTSSNEHRKDFRTIVKRSISFKKFDKFYSMHLWFSECTKGNLKF